MSAGRLIRLDVEDTVRTLSDVPLFSGCSEPELREIAERAHLLTFDDGEVVVLEGEEGSGFYLIVSGEGRVTRGGDELALLAAGDFFGEESLLEWTPRTASVSAVGRTVCLELIRTDFKTILVRNPRLALRILEEEARRARARARIRPAPE
jgi:CRP-like cAMP-binding protein